MSCDVCIKTRIQNYPHERFTGTAVSAYIQVMTRESLMFIHDLICKLADNDSVLAKRIMQAENDYLPEKKGSTFDFKDKVNCTY